MHFEHTRGDKMMKGHDRGSSFGRPTRCGIILAAGDGKRLQSFIRRLQGNTLPKQFVNFLGSRSLLEQTFHRAEKLIAPECLFTVVGRDHLRYLDVRRQLSSRPEKTVIVQPENKDTGPGLFLPLTHLAKHYPESVIAVFPSDHFIVEEDPFMDHVATAFRFVERNPSRLVLLGIKPQEPEPGYGYILPGRRIGDLASVEVRTVLGFVEKPEAHAADALIRNGGLWNSFVMVFRAKTMLNLMALTSPDLYLAYQRIGKAIGTPIESDVVEAVYGRMQPMNFSREILEHLARRYRSHLAVLSVADTSWSDWGSEPRILSDLKRLGYLKELHEISPKNPAETQTV